MNLLNKFLVFLVIACCTWGGAYAQVAPAGETGRVASLSGTFGDSLAPASRWAQRVDYVIDVSLNTVEHTLDGFMKIVYSNHSPNTLSFIWIQCWPNAYKSDRTSFSDQLLENGSTDFYFSDKGRRGYINHLDFRVGGIIAKMEDHPHFLDVIKIVLPEPLAPGCQVTISTPFHEQLPFPFSGSGYTSGNYQITQWFPQPAVYDQEGWHPMPKLDQGGAYNEFGDYDVRITVPKNYKVAATGALATEEGGGKPEAGTALDHSGIGTQTLRFREKNSSGFAWFADSHFQTEHDTLQLPSGRVIDLYTYYTAVHAPLWHPYSMAAVKRALLFRSRLTGEYPYDVIRIAEIPASGAGAGFPETTFQPTSAETVYPTLAGIATPGTAKTLSLSTERDPDRSTAKDLDLFIQHAIGLQWFQGILGADGRANPWMTVGLNEYYDRRYRQIYYPKEKGTPRRPDYHAPPQWIKNKLPADPAAMMVGALREERMDQPISSRSEDFTLLNYNLIAYTGTALWLKGLEDTLGRELFDRCMQAYCQSWAFHQPGPRDLRAAFERTSDRNLGGSFAVLRAEGPISGTASSKKIRPTFLFSARNTEQVSYINVAPGVGYNTYDHFMIGALVHNFGLAPHAFQFLLAPLYATNSRRFAGAGYLGYSWYPQGSFQKIGLGLEGAKFSSFSGADSNGNKLFGGFYKVAPSVRLTFKNKTARSTVREWLEWRTFLIGEQAFTGYVQKSTDSLSYPAAVGRYQFRYLNQVGFNIEDNRVLYPYRALLQVQQGPRFYRVNFTGNYFFNYEAGGGMDLRFFAAKFGYLGGSSSSLDLTRYQPKLTGVGGAEDYTYSNYFVGRNDYTGVASQQIMIRDGGLKIRVPNFPFLEGRSDDWVSALNLSSTLPTAIVPRWMPLKVFLDIGSYAGGWKENALTSRFLYTAGLQLSLFHNIVNVYAPLFYSSDFGDQLKTIPDQNTFFKKLSFSIDLQHLSPRPPFLNHTPL